ncbi:hypothetical protein [Streptomyces malaysiense]|uniref:Uncharacterized protein n=1 Tax=Streptomyces malaysiense TaxID=1428626 RepID=A0A1J4Q8Y3_9ACTN|nr:hypothetical protein [Streptomyces malaysiense]OIK29490.1 hypothetical protein VT52_000010 [Streptomyces malaysiense]
MNHSPVDGAVREPVEERLRAALAARANAVGPADLRPLRPPSGALRAHRLSLRGTVVGLLALAAVAALVLLTLRDSGTRPSEPARPPRPTFSTPSPVPGSASPTPVASPSSPESDPP